MNFFEDQERARKQTRKLLFLYFLAVGLTSVGTGVVLIYFLRSEGQEDNIQLFLAYCVIPLLVILLASFFKIKSLGTGGEYVAKATGATPVDLNTRDPLLKRYVNIVEEMSIASGTPTPQIYVLENEKSINAFAAGYEIDNAVVAVSQGALEELNRDELQGVVAHEFSHIFNGDMKIGIRLIGYLYGLVVLKQIAYFLMRSSSRGGRVRSRDKKDGAAGLVVIGLAFFIVSSIGVFLASLIKAAVSRQREYLADASAVQFTRNPDGISGALKKILSHGQIIKPKGDDEVAHLYFSHEFNQLFSTHPPLLKRIKAIEPSFRLEHFQEEMMKRAKRELRREEADKKRAEKKDKTKKKSVIDHLIEPHGGSVAYAGSIYSAIAGDDLESLRSLNGAKAFLYYLFIDQDVDTSRSQIKSLVYKESIEVVKEIKRHTNRKKEVSAETKLPLIDLSLPSLKKMSLKEKSQFIFNLKELVLSDGKIKRDEFLNFCLIKESLISTPSAIDRSPSKTKQNKAKEIIYSFLKNIDSDEKADKLVKHLSKALGVLKTCPPLVKEEVLSKSVEIVKGDDEITHTEYETIRVLAESMLVPMPMIKPGLLKEKTREN